MLEKGRQPKEGIEGPRSPDHDEGPIGHARVIVREVADKPGNIGREPVWALDVRRDLLPHMGKGTLGVPLVEALLSRDQVGKVLCTRPPDPIEQQPLERDGQHSPPVGPKLLSQSEDVLPQLEFLARKVG